MDTLGLSPALLAPLIFGARVADVSLGTLRTLLVFRGRRLTAASIGFVEVLLWIGAAGLVLNNLTTWYFAVAYAAGFATGNYVGMYLESKLAIGMEMVRVISESPDVRLAERLREHDHHIVALDGRDAGSRPVEVLLVVEKRRRIPRLLRLIDESDPGAVYTVSDIRHHRVSTPPGATPQGVTPSRRPPWLSARKRK